MQFNLMINQINCYIFKFKCHISYRFIHIDLFGANTISVKGRVILKMGVMSDPFRSAECGCIIYHVEETTGYQSQHANSIVFI